jgi:hypothetical protein
MPDPSTPPDVEKRRSKPPNTLGWEERAGWPLVSVSLFDLLCADLDVGAPLLVALPPSLACLADVSVVCCCCCCGCGCGCGCCCCELLLPNLEATDCSHDPRRDPAPGPAGALLGAPFLPKVIRLVDIGGGGGASSAGAWAVLVVGWLGVDDVGATAIGESSAGGPDVDDMVFVMAFCLLCLSVQDAALWSVQALPTLLVSQSRLFRVVEQYTFGRTVRHPRDVNPRDVHVGQPGWDPSLRIVELARKGRL